MNKNLKAALLFLLVAFACIGAYKGLHAWLLARQQTAVSDAKVNLTIKFGGDEYLGYFFLNSPEMKKQAARLGIGINFTNDKGAYAERLEKFDKGEYDAIVLPINSYLQHGAKYKYPGVIVASIAESKGADAILAFADKMPTGTVKDLNDASLKIVYTAQSPSSFLVDLTMVDFELFNLQKTDAWRVPVNGSSEVYAKAKNHDGDVFVMWEPDVSNALRDVPGLKVVWGSDQFSGYIDDVFVFRRDYLQAHEADVVSFFQAYFSAMRTYKSDRPRLIEDMKQLTGAKQAEIEVMLKKIDWHDLQTNCSREFGLKIAGNHAEEGVVNTIIACINVLVKTGTVPNDPVGDPYKIVNSNILKQVQATLPKDIGSAGGNQRAFSQLSDSDWKGLHEVGTMHVEPITFQTGSSTLDQAGEEQVDKIAEQLANNYPDTRVVVKGHTGAGDETENLRLSQERAEAVVQRLITVHKMSANRLRSVGKGSSEPPELRPDENQRAYMYRLPRVEFVLYTDNGF